MARRRMIDPGEEKFNWKERNFKKARIPNAIRNHVVIRDGGVCQYCGKQGIIEDFYGLLRVYEPICNGNHRIPFELDHVIPEFLGGSTDADNLKLACRKCNRGHGARLKNKEVDAYAT